MPVVTRLLIRAALICGVALLAGGTQIAPHEHVAGWTHEGLDHPPSAVHATLLEHLRYLLEQSQQNTAPAPGADRFEAAPAAVTVAGSVVLALFAFGAPRVWRPSRLGVARLVESRVASQFALAPALAPPRASFSS